MNRWFEPQNIIFLIEHVRESTVKNELCKDYKPGDDDLQTFDFISKLKLDMLNARYSGMTKVRGSNRMQTAYRLEKDTDVTLQTKYIQINSHRNSGVVSSLSEKDLLIISTVFKLNKKKIIYIYIYTVASFTQ